MLWLSLARGCHVFLFNVGWFLFLRESGKLMRGASPLWWVVPLQLCGPPHTAPATHQHRHTDSASSNLCLTITITSFKPVNTRSLKGNFCRIALMYILQITFQKNLKDFWKCKKYRKEFCISLKHSHRADHYRQPPQIRVLLNIGHRIECSRPFPC